jgi:restriction endonuclease
MPDLPDVTPDYFRILVVRELRKAGFDVGEVRTHRRSELPEPEQGFVLELVVPLSRPGTAWGRRALVVCRRQAGAVDRDVVESTVARLTDAQAEVAIVFATADFSADALAAAQEGGVALLRVVDGRSAIDMSGWSTPGHYPAWLPAYLAQVVDRDVAGQPRARLLEAGRPDMILDCLRVEARS